MKVHKAWQFLLLHPQKGYYTGYKGDEMFGELDRAKVYRTRDEAFMDTLSVKYKLELEQVLIWHRSLGDTKPRAVKLAEESAVSIGNDVRGSRATNYKSSRPHLTLVHSQ